MSMFVLHCGRFLTPLASPAVRSSPVLYFAQYTKIVQKKLKPSAAEPEPSSSAASSSLSPEQLDKIARNKRAALDRLASAQTPPGFGESWRKELSAEFGKPYFKQVRTKVKSPPHCTLCLCVFVFMLTPRLRHSWWVLCLRRGNATLCTHLLNTSSPGLRCVTSEMWVKQHWPRKMLWHHHVFTLSDLVQLLK